MGLSPAYCNSCRSHSCSHALQINEHNIRVEFDRVSIGLGGMVSSPPVTLTVPEGTVMTLASDTPKNKKLLLLGRR